MQQCPARANTEKERSQHRNIYTIYRLRGSISLQRMNLSQPPLVWETSPSKSEIGLEKLRDMIVHGKLDQAKR